MPHFLKVEECRTILQTSDTYIDIQKIVSIRVDDAETITIAVPGALHMLRTENPLHEKVKKTLEAYANLDLKILRQKVTT